MGCDTVKLLHGVLWWKYSAILRLKRKRSHSLTSCTQRFHLRHLAIYYWHTLIWPAFELLHSSPCPGNYLTGGIHSLSSSLRYQSKRWDSSPSRKVGGGCAHFYLSILWSKYCTDFISLPTHLNSNPSKHDVQFLCSDCIELFDYVWIRITYCNTQVQVPVLCCWSSL